MPLEGQLDLPHPYGVGVLLPEVTAFNLSVLPAKVKPLAEALEVDTFDLGRNETIAACAEAIRALYAGIAARDYDHTTANDNTVIACPSARKMTVRQAEELFERCLA